MKYSAATVLAVATLCTSAAHSAEFRGALGVSTGDVKYSGDFGQKLTADTQSRSLSVEYHFEDAGPFIGASVARTRTENIKVNGFAVGGSENVTNTLVAMGYRGGALGAAQPFGAVSVTRSEADGQADSAFGAHAGVERTSRTGRVSVQVSYHDEDEFNSYGAAVTGVAFLSEALGISATAGTSRGSGKLGATDLDGTSWTIGIGVEFRH